jgi:hypothetical protein
MNDWTDWPWSVITRRAARVLRRESLAHMAIAVNVLNPAWRSYGCGEWLAVIVLAAASWWCVPLVWQRTHLNKTDYPLDGRWQTWGRESLVLTFSILMLHQSRFYPWKNKAVCPWHEEVKNKTITQFSLNRQCVWHLLHNTRFLDISLISTPVAGGYWWNFLVKYHLMHSLGRVLHWLFFFLSVSTRS